MGPVVGTKAQGQGRGWRETERKDGEVQKEEEVCRKQETERQGEKASEPERQRETEVELGGGQGREPRTQRGQGVGRDGTRASKAVP